ncbi:MAG: creatininase family protein [Fimbriimonas sp.]
MLRLVEMHPGELSEAWARVCPAILPLGAIEWHGDHLPLGLDSLVAEAFCKRLAERLDGVLLPTLTLPITTLPHPHSLDAPSEIVTEAWKATVGGLIRSGARTVLIVTGHYAQGHCIELYRFAESMMVYRQDFRVFAASPLEPLATDAFLDHAARFETSQLLAIRPDLVRLDAIQTLDPKQSAILGEDPRDGSAGEGMQLLDDAVEAWSHWVQTANQAELREWYAARQDAYQPYVEQYFRESWEQAMNNWWASKD